VFPAPVNSSLFALGRQGLGGGIDDGGDAACIAQLLHASVGLPCQNWQLAQCWLAWCLGYLALSTWAVSCL